MAILTSEYLKRQHYNTALPCSLSLVIVRALTTLARGVECVGDNLVLQAVPKLHAKDNKGNSEVNRGDFVVSELTLFPNYSMIFHFLYVGLSLTTLTTTFACVISVIHF